MDKNVCALTHGQFLSFLFSFFFFFPFFFYAFLGSGHVASSFFFFPFSFPFPGCSTTLILCRVLFFLTIQLIE